jgi:Fe-Mn family superoxide dismutase
MTSGALGLALERRAVPLERNYKLRYEPKDFSSLLGMEGFSDKLLNDHFGLYQGYVDHTNELLEKLTKLGTSGKLGSVEHSELRRRLGWEFDGMRLHELYFGNLNGTCAGTRDFKVS